MSFVQREIARLNAELATYPDGPRYAELYAAQQALAWSLEPTGFGAPYDVIKGGTLANSKDCLVELHPQQSSGMDVPSG